MIRCSRVGQHIEYAGKSQREGMKISTILHAYMAGGAVSLNFSVKQIFFSYNKRGKAKNYYYNVGCLMRRFRQPFLIPKLSIKPTTLILFVLRMADSIISGAQAVHNRGHG